MSSFPKILSLKSFGNSWGNSCVQFGDNLMFYFSTISWLRLQQETKWVNVNFERRDLTSAQKKSPCPRLLVRTVACLQYSRVQYSSVLAVACLIDVPLGWYTYDVHENWPIFKTSHRPLSSCVQNSSTPLTLDVQFQTKPPSSLSLTSESKWRYLVNNILLAWCLVMAKIQFSLIKK